MSTQISAVLHVDSCVLAHSGAEALEKMALNPVCAVVTAINLPRMDGYDLTRRIRQIQGHAHTPIIMTSCEQDLQDITMGLQAGADVYLVKPVALDQLVDTLNAQLSRGGTG